MTLPTVEEVEKVAKDVGEQQGLAWLYLGQFADLLRFLSGQVTEITDAPVEVTEASEPPVQTDHEGRPIRYWGGLAKSKQPAGAVPVAYLYQHEETGIKFFRHAEEPTQQHRRYIEIPLYTHPAADGRDAQRYRHIRNRGWDFAITQCIGHVRQLLSGDELNAAIDAAIASQGKEP